MALASFDAIDGQRTVTGKATFANGTILDNIDEIGNAFSSYEF
jgi:hypothetical protein